MRLRDPLAVDPQLVLRETSIDPAGVVAHWEPYQSLDPQFVLKRAQEALAPPPTVTLAIDGDRIAAIGTVNPRPPVRRCAGGRMLTGVSRIWAAARSGPGLVRAREGRRGRGHGSQDPGTAPSGCAGSTGRGLADYCSPVFESTSEPATSCSPFQRST